MEADIRDRQHILKSFKGQVKGLEKAHHKQRNEIKELREALDDEKSRHKQVDEVKELRKDLDAFFEQYRYDGVHRDIERGTGG